ncbi:UxaA family hydrolase [Fulvitalea axinellae]
MKPTLQINPNDNVAVALRDLDAGELVSPEGPALSAPVSFKHKVALADIAKGEKVVMYGVSVGEALRSLKAGEPVAYEDLKQLTDKTVVRPANPVSPDMSGQLADFEGVTFDGYHRADGKVGTSNVWLIIPLVFCVNKKSSEIGDILIEQLGYAKRYKADLANFIDAYKNGGDVEAGEPVADFHLSGQEKVFKNVDGIKILTHDAGCGGTRADAKRFCDLLAGYIAHPNTAGATIISLGCQNAQIPMIKESLAEQAPELDKPIYFHEQQQLGSEKELVRQAVASTLKGLVRADKAVREPAPLSKLTLGLECGGSDGFSGITANPTMGLVSDMLVGAGGTSILGEFPELGGAEQDIVDRCVKEDLAHGFLKLMEDYRQKAEASGSGFDCNPSPGNIKDGLLTGAMKSAGAAQKGGRSPITDVLDYTGIAKEAGLNLLCTPGNDVESTTALVGSGANVVLFSTGLGTPTGNPLAPVIKISSNSNTAQRMRDVIDFDAGPVATEGVPLETKAKELLRLVVEVASGRHDTKSWASGQDDFIVWKHDVSL